MTSVSNGARRPGIAEHGGELGRALPYAFAFLIPAGGGFSLEAVGTLYGSDLLVLLAALVLFLQNKAFRGVVEIKGWLFLAALWVFFQITTDIVRETPAEDYLRGWANLGLALVYLLVAYTLFKQDLNIIRYWLAGSAVGILITVFSGNALFVEQLISANAWKFYYSGVVAGLAFLVFSSRRVGPHYLTCAAVFFLLSTISFISAGRSAGAVLFLVALASIAMGILGRDTRHYRVPSALTTWSMIGSGLMFVILMLWIYSEAAAAGWLGELALERHEFTTSRDIEGIAGVILGGRAEHLVVWRAIAESPFLGHGSWAKDWNYFIDYLVLTGQTGLIQSDILFTSRTPILPTHSFLTGAWVQAGVFGTFFWIAALILSLKLVVQVTFLRHPLALYIFFLCVNMIWNIFFSPFGGQGRMTVMASLAAMIVFSRMVIEPTARSGQTTTGR